MKAGATKKNGESRGDDTDSETATTATKYSGTVLETISQQIILLHYGEKIYNTTTKEGKNQGTQTKKGKKYKWGKGREETKKPRAVHPWSIKPKEVLLKPITEAEYPPLYRLYDYCGCTKETLVPDMDTKECRQLLITGRCIFGKFCKYNHLAATKKQVKDIKDKLKRFISYPLGITGEKKVTMAQYINAIL